MDKIKKLITSNNEEDVLIGVVLLYKYYDGKQGPIKEFMKRLRPTVRLDIYIGTVNIVLYGDHISASVFPAEMAPLANIRTIRL